MSKRNIVLIGGLITGLLFGGSVLAQTPKTYPTDGGNDAVYNKSFEKLADEGYTIDGSAKIVYITKGGRAPFYVAPSLVLHPTWNATSVVDLQNDNGQPLDITTSKWGWSVIADKNTTPTPATVGGPYNGTVTVPAVDQGVNKGVITAGEVGKVVVAVAEKTTAPEFADCSSQIIPTQFVVCVTSEPEFGFDPDEKNGIKITSTSGELHAKPINSYEYTGGPAWRNDLIQHKYLLIQSCSIEKLNQQITLKYVAKETVDGTNPLPSELQKYAFKVEATNVVEINESGSHTNGSPTMTTVEEHGLDNKKDNITNHTQTFTISGFTALSGNTLCKEMIFRLTSVTGVGDNGVVSATSHKSYVLDDTGLSAAMNIKGFPYKDYAFVVVRLTKAPKTGPIYHIPNNAFI